jgi:hypothetical protein
MDFGERVTQETKHINVSSPSHPFLSDFLYETYNVSFSSDPIPTSLAGWKTGRFIGKSRDIGWSLEESYLLPPWLIKLP